MPNSQQASSSQPSAVPIGRTLNPEMIACLEEELQRCTKNTKHNGAKNYVLGLRKALSSLEKYPKKLYNGNEAKTLKGIGDKMAYRIDKYLKDKNIDLGTPPSTTTTTGGSSAPSSMSQQDENDQPEKKRKRSNRKYVPKFKTAAWAIMISLYRHIKENEVDHATKTQLISLCETLTDVPMEQSNNGSKYTGWSSIKTLSEKELIYTEKRGRSKGYIFTKKGKKLARKLHMAEKEVSDRDFLWEETEESSSEEEPEVPKEKPAKKKKQNTTSSVGSLIELNQHSQASQQSETETTTYDSDPELCLDIYSQLGFQSKPAPNSINENLASQSSQVSRNSELSDDDEVIFEERNGSAPATSTSSSLNTVYTILSDDEDEDVAFDYSELPLKFNYMNALEKPVSRLQEAKFYFSATVGEIRIKLVLKSPLQNEDALEQIFDEIIEKKRINNELSVVGFIRESRCTPHANNLAKNLIIDPTLFKFYSTTNNNNSKPTESSSKVNHTDKISTQPTSNYSPPINNSPVLSKPTLFEIELSDEDEDSSQRTENHSTQQKSSKKKKQTNESQEYRSTPAITTEREHLETETSQQIPPFISNVARPREMTRTLDFSQMPPPSFIPARSLVPSLSASGSQATNHNQTPTTPVILNSNRQPKTIVNLKSFLENPTRTPSFSMSTNSPITKSSDLPKDPYKIHLIIDQRERTGHNDRKTFCDTLKKRGVDALISQLGMGDVIWTLNTSEGSHVLNYVLERKDINDLAGSIKDGRYKEQKFRMNNSNCSNIFYLIERSFKHQDQLAQSSLETSLRKILTDGIGVKHTPSLESSINFLVLLNSLIIESVEREGLTPHQLLIPHDITGEMYNPSLEEYNVLFKKNNDIPKHEIFGRQLTTIQGLSPQIAESIIKKHPTPSSLCQAFLDSAPPHDMALKNFPIESSVDGVCTRKIGTKLSQKIHQYFFQD